MDVLRFSSVNVYSRRAMGLSAALLAGRTYTLCIYIQWLTNILTPRGIVAKTLVAASFAKLGVQVLEYMRRRSGLSERLDALHFHLTAAEKRLSRSSP